MSRSKISQFKPFLRVTILSMILAFLLIYLGINYHWGDFLKTTPATSSVLPIPEKIESTLTTFDVNQSDSSTEYNFNPEIIDTGKSNSILESMNKEQMAEHCTKLLSKQIIDPLTLELATVNCVMSNFEETYQNSNNLDDKATLVTQKNIELNKQCSADYNQGIKYSAIEKELLIGICVSDRLNSSNN